MTAAFLSSHTYLFVFLVLFFLLQILILSLFVLFFHLPGFPLSTLSVLLVTYCGVQLVKERERKQALLEEPEPTKLKAE